MNNVGFYDSFFATVMFASFTLPVFVYFLNCLINYSTMVKYNPAKPVKKTVKEQHKPIVLNFNLAKHKEGNYRGRRVQLNKPRVNKKNPKKGYVYVKTVNTPKPKTVKVNFTNTKHVSKPKKPTVKTPENDNIIKESVKTLKTLGYKSGEVKKTLQDLCISNQFKNTESLIEAFFKSGTG